MKLYQKVSILAVVGALSLNGDLARADADESPLTDADLYALHQEGHELGTGVMCTICAKVKGWIGDSKQKCTSGFCTAQIGYMAGKWIVANKKKACDNISKNKEKICGYDWGSAKKTESTLEKAMKTVCGVDCSKN